MKESTLKDRMQSEHEVGFKVIKGSDKNIEPTVDIEEVSEEEYNRVYSEVHGQREIKKGYEQYL